MSGLYRYSVIRFRPFAETGEFVNVGVIVLDAETGQIAYALAPQHSPRIRGFFDTPVHGAYAAAITLLELELSRLKEMVVIDQHLGRVLFDETIRRRESSIAFGSPGALQSAEPLQAAADRLFGQHVRLSPASPERGEKALTKRIRDALHRRGLEHFKAVRIEDAIVPVEFPFGYRNGTLHAIKPIAFAQKSPLAIFDHGASWRKRFDYLREQAKIEDRHLLIALQPPAPDAGAAIQEAYGRARDELSPLPFDLVEADEGDELNDRVIAFARRVAPFQHSLMH